MIIDKRESVNPVTFKSLSIGDFFTWDSRLFVKTTEANEGLDEEYGAVFLGFISDRDDEPPDQATFDENDKVVLVKTDIIVTG